MSQEEFADKFEIGTQGMVWQYLNGYSPLNLEAAIKFARALRCTIGDFSPSLEQVLRPAFSDGLVTGVRTDYSSEATKVMEIFESLDRDGRKSVQDCAEKEKLIIELKSAQPTEVKKFG
jgi:transcriptional regulator with XRE-family HTH domain